MDVKVVISFFFFFFFLRNLRVVISRREDLLAVYGDPNLKVLRIFGFPNLHYVMIIRTVTIRC